MCCLALVGCYREVYVDSEGEIIHQPVSANWHTKVKIACLDGIEYWVYNPRSQTSTMAVHMKSPTEAKTCD